MTAGRWCTVLGCLLIGLVLGGAPGALAGEAEAHGDSRRLRARELSWEGDYGPSLSLYAELRAERPDDLALIREMGLVQLWAGDERGAIASLERVLADSPTDDEARLSLGRAHFYRGDAKRAVGPYLLVLPRYQEDPAVVAEAVEVFRAGGRPDLAERWLDWGLSRFPGRPELSLALARQQIARGELGAADRTLAKALAGRPEPEETHRALEELQRALASPGRRAELLGERGDYRRARSLLLTHLRAHPDDDSARLQLARYDAWSGAYREAQRQYRELLGKRPDDRRLRTELAEVTSWRGEYGPARALLEELIREQPTDLRPRLALANVHAWSGVHRLADPLYRAILAEAPEHVEAARALRNLELVRSPSLEPGVGFFRDSEGFELWSAESEALYSPRPGRTWSLALDLPRISGRRILGFDPESGEARTERVRVQGEGFRLGWSERPDERWELRGEIGAVRYSRGGASPRVRLALTRWLGYRHQLQLDLRHEEAVTEVRSIESVLAGVQRSTAFLVHAYQGERVTTWSRAEAGTYSDGHSFWTVRTVLGLGLLRRPFELDLLGSAALGDYSRPSELYYSPQDLLTYAVGLRVKKRVADRLDLVVIGEYGRIHSDGGQGVTWRVGPELLWELGDRMRLYLRYDHYQSLREGLVYASDFVQLGLRLRFPGSP